MKNNKNKTVNDVELRNKSRINAYISTKNYNAISEIISKYSLGSMKLSKGLVLDIAISQLVQALDVGESIESLAIQFLENGDDVL